ncbi:FAD/NAD(P)-binding oxidoreductase [Xylophilus sp. GOD-11R]|uniref:NAD(P)/FAD-dependent oxidoreductase n=1 Tax=Xylophilus sp. GOD-11R TaxID=3089814 RepID=UPI00298D2F7E|nr:FAD/NAD(P)-binding oxidoreductase [Xylophilus sp. GOD-11R]WPB59506.1 FAD/NAD(P)-binding oxidoreductase [Xylophilus sp. GOD-11R]
MNQHQQQTSSTATQRSSDILIVGGGAAGIAVAASLRRRDRRVGITIVDPATEHCYQPGWTMVGAGIFESARTVRPMASVIPPNVRWLRDAVSTFDPEARQVRLASGATLGYGQLIVCPGLLLDWAAIEGLPQTLGRNGVTSNYRVDLAPYTWQLVQGLRGGKALFTQPPMPIKCAGAPQKAMYLSADHWRAEGRLGDVDIQFSNAGAVLFGVAAYVPALMEYVAAYGIGLNFGENLVAVDGERKVATFVKTGPDGSRTRIERAFDLLHVVPPQRAPDFIRDSMLADGAGWLEVDPATLRHKRYADVFGLGDVVNTSNAKTAAAARKQAPVVARNVLAVRAGREPVAAYDGYGSCPLTVARGRIVLAEFTYGGTLAPSFPQWLLDGTRPTALAWHLKKSVLPRLYWQGMLKGREWLAAPASLPG